MTQGRGEHMVINHNMPSLNHHRIMKTNVKNTEDSSRKLSSGYRINEDADDAAGLCISETMRHQVRGLDRASSNVQDGISMIQTADAALEETQQILDRMVELATRAANDINTTADRTAIQDEVEQLKSEIDHIAYDTNFNQQYMLAEGTPKAKPGFFKIQAGSLADQSVTINFVNASKESLGVADVDMTSYEGASESIAKIQNAIEIAATWRDQFGATQEQLEHATKNLDNTTENTQRAESNIRDTNMNEEMLSFTTNRILLNASQSLLAQFNTQPQAVLMLLK